MNRHTDWLLSSLLVGAVTLAMVLILVHGVELFLALVTRILKHSREVLVFHMPSQYLPCAHVSTDVAFKMSFTDLFNVVVQIKLISSFLVDTLIAHILRHFPNRNLQVFHQLTGF